MPAGINVSFTQDTIIENNTIYNVLEAIQNTGATWMADGQLVYSAQSITPSGTIIRGNIIHNNLCEQGVMSIVGNNILIENNLLYDNMGNGTTCGISTRNGKFIVRNNVITNSGGVRADRRLISSYNVIGEISHNTIANGDNRGINIQYDVTPSDSLLIKNNIIYSIANQQIYKSGDTSKVVLDYNLFGKNQTNLGTHYIVGDPKFINTANPEDDNFFHPQPDSPACNNGESGTYLGAFPCSPIRSS
jgi:hypothetical protein